MGCSEGKRDAKRTNQSSNDIQTCICSQEASPISGGQWRDTRLLLGACVFVYRISNVSKRVNRNEKYKSSCECRVFRGPSIKVLSIRNKSSDDEISIYMARTFIEAMYQAVERVMLPLMLLIILQVSPKSMPIFAMACLSNFIESLIFPQVLAKILFLLVVFVFVDVVETKDCMECPSSESVNGNVMFCGVTNLEESIA